MFVSAFAGSSSPLLLIPMALAVVASVGFSLYSFRKEKQRSDEIDRSYANRLVALNKEMHTYHDLQRRFYRYNYPDRQATFQIVRQSRQDAEKTKRTLRSEARLWERRTSDEDFGVVRLGIGTLPSTVTYILGDVEDYNDPQSRVALKLATDSRFVSEIPVIISLRQPPPEDKVEEDDETDEEAAGKNAGRPRASASRASAARSMSSRARCWRITPFFTPPPTLGCICSRTTPASGPGPSICRTARATSRTTSAASRARSRSSRASAPSTTTTAASWSSSWRASARCSPSAKSGSRSAMKAQAPERRDAAVPAGGRRSARRDLRQQPPLQSIETDAALSILLEEGHLLGAAVIFLVPERSKVPSNCRAVIEIEKTTPATNSRIEQNQKLHFRYTEVGVNSPHYVGEADAVANLGETRAAGAGHGGDQRAPEQRR